MSRIVVATRKSPLALAQTRAFVRALIAANPGLEVEELHVVTTGDRVTDRPLSEVGGKGLFVKEIEEALLEGRAQLAVHSSKDVPAELPPGLVLACFPERVDARDVLITRDGGGLGALPAGARIGTSSLRRRLQLGALRPDATFVPLRGNVDTRLRRVDEGAVDAAVLAAAGLARLGVARGHALTVEECLPAAGQGALAIETRDDAAAVRAVLAPLHHPETALAVAAERGVLRAVEGSCQVPVAAHALRAQGTLYLRGLLAEADGTRPRTAEARVPWPTTITEAEGVGLALGRGLLR